MEKNRERNNKMKKHIALFGMLVICVCMLLAGCGGSGKSSVTADMQDYKDLNKPGVRVGALSGGIGPELVEKELPEAELMTYNNYVDMLMAIDSGKIDAIVEDGCTLLYHNMQMDDRYRKLDGYLKEFSYGYAFSKTDEGYALASQMSGFIKKCKEDGTLDELYTNWLTSEGEAKMKVDYESLPATNGVIRMATTSTSPPFTYVENNKTIGYDIDVVSRFCEEYGYGLEISSMSFDGLIPAVSSGRCDLAGAAIVITDERKESVEFSEAYFDGGEAAAVLADSAAGSGGFFMKMKDSFVKTFIREDRYKMFINGILTTLLITVLSAIAGTLLGFAVFMCCRGGNRAANMITKICTGLIQGLPVVVILMILYYIIFASAPVTGAFVSVIAFTLTFASAVYSMVRTGVSAIDTGQTEAAYALGVGKNKTFFKIVLPQAVPYILPQYKGELVSLIKATAIVGYIAVEDLTRTGDLVRSRTYEAFFPLIAVAVIYFLMARILIFAAGRIEISIDPKRRKREDILKGLNINDWTDLPQEKL